LSLTILNQEQESSQDDRLICAVLLLERPGSGVGSARRLTADVRGAAGSKGVVAQTIETDEPTLLRM
jgi:hypothetical protein